MSYLLQAIALLIEIVFGAVVTLLTVRFLAEACRAEFNNPLSQSVYRYTNPVLAPMRRFIPNWRRINLAALLLAWVVMLLEQLALFLIAGFLPHVPGLLLYAFAQLLDFVLVFYLVLIFAWSVMTMLSVDGRQPFFRLADAIVSPPLRPLRGKLTIGSIDFSPTLVMIGLLLARILVAEPLLDVGKRLALGG